jgi:hypothetical protein
MAKAKKTKIEKEEIPTEQIVPEFGLVGINQEKYEDCEWCFQFDNDEPQIFAWMDDELNKDEDPKVMFSITNVKDSYINFTHQNGKVFKLFAREISEQGKELREKQRVMISQMKEDEREYQERLQQITSVLILYHLNFNRNLVGCSFQILENCSKA